MNNSSDYRNRLLAVSEIFSQDLSLRRKLDSLKTAVRNINPLLDEKLDHCCHAWDHLDKLRDGKITELVVENLPEGSEAEKKRKQKARLLVRFYRNLESGNFIDITGDLLPEETEEEKERKKKFFLFVRLWRDLESEVKRLQSEFNQFNQPRNKPTHQVNILSRVVSLAKGPLGLTTAAATLIVGGLILLKSVAVEVVIFNRGCDTISPALSVPVNLPGFSLPSRPILSGQSGLATVPPLTVEVDNQQNGNWQVAAYGLKFSFAVPGGVEVSFDGRNLSSQKSALNLGSVKKHELVIQCSVVSGKILKVIEFNRQKIPLDNLVVAVGPECGREPHYHAKDHQSVLSLSGQRISDPGGCGFGTVQGTAILEANSP